ncbi:MAG: DUF547 domain-containing protein [Bradymonadaceae bacterium]|nr:DUF547 domain-containing protein [Lujinxingiaceae bacterium]
MRHKIQSLIVSSVLGVSLAALPSAFADGPETTAEQATTLKKADKKVEQAEKKVEQAEKKVEQAEKKVAKAEKKVERAEKKAEMAGDADVIDHAPFEALLNKYVDRRGMVAYGRWHGDSADRAALASYVKQVGEAKLDAKSKSARLAFYINAYNALVLDAIISKWPVESVMKLDGFFNKDVHTVAGQKMTLDDLEHNKVIRVQFDEPRIHFVLVCAAKSCPRLRTSAMTHANLEQNLEAATREFVPQATRVEGNTVYTTQLFNWFRQDFEKHSGSIEAYIARYVSAEQAKVLQLGSATVEFTEYDWAINKQ